MNTLGTKNKLLTFLLIVLPVVSAFGTYVYFQNQSKNSSQQLTAQKDEEGSVAGAATQDVADITGLFPMYPNADIVNVDRSEEKTSLTLSSETSQQMIEDWYASFFLTNGWKRLENPREYEKGMQRMTAEIRDGIIRLSVTQKK